MRESGGYPQETWQRGDSPANGNPGSIFYINHKEHRTQWDHPLLSKIFDEDIASYNDVRYAAYRTALKFRAICHRLQLHQIKLTTVRNVLKQHGYEAVYQNQTLIPIVELETLMADIYLSARREYPSIDQPETNAELLLSLLLKLYDTSRYGCVKLISAKIGLALLASGSYLEKWKYILGELFDYNRCLSRKNAYALLHDVARIPEVLGEKRLFGTHLVQAAVDSLWIRGHPTTVGLPEDGFRYWLRDEPQTLVWLSTSYRIRQAEKLRHFVKCSICKAYPIIGLRYRCLRCYNYNMCQSCFFTGKFNKSHRLRHPIREYCSLVSAGQETKDLIKIMKNRVFKGEQYEQKPRYMPILPDSASALEVGADSEPETDNRSRSTAPSHTSLGTPSGSVHTVNKKDFEVDVEVISELDRQESSLDRSTAHIPRSVSEPVEAHMRFAQQEHQQQFQQLQEEEEIHQARQGPRQPFLAEKEMFTSEEEEMPVTSEPSRVQTQREICQVTAQILNYAEVDVLLPKLKIVPIKQSAQPVNYTQVQVPKVPLIQERKYEDKPASRRENTKEFSAIDYIDNSPRREPFRHDAARPYYPTSLYPAVVDKSSVQIQTDVEEFKPAGVKMNGYNENNWKINGQRNAPNRIIRDQRDELNHRLADSSESSSPELLLNGRHYRQPTEYNAHERNAILESHLERLERTLIDGLGPMSAASTSSPSSSQPVHVESSSPVWKLDTRQTTNGYHKGQSQPDPRSASYITRTTSFNDELHRRTDSRLPPFPVESAMKAKAASDPNTPLRKLPSIPPRKDSVSDGGSLSGHPAYHPILDELEEKLKSLNAPLTQRDLRHPFWRHVRDKFENLLGSQVNKPATSVTYQSYGKIDKDYARTPASYGNTTRTSMSHLDVTDGLLPVINQPSPNESQSSGFSSGRETDLKWEEESYHGSASARLSANNYRAVHRSKSMGLSSHRQVNDDIAQLDKLLEWLDEFKRSA